MLLENSLKKYKELPEAIKQIVGLVGLTATIIFTFMIMNTFIDESEKVEENVKTEEINEVITSLPRGRLNFYESTEGHQLSLSEYEAVCKNTKIVTQRSIMGANIVNISATQLYFDNGNKIDKYSVKWDSSLNKCFAGYTIRAIEGVSDTITVSGEAKGFFKTSIDTRVYFIKNY
jgi:hypothetical protein